MGIRTDASGDYIRRTASLPALDNFTACGWSKRVNTRTNNYQTIFGLEDNGGGHYLMLGWNSSNNFVIEEWAAPVTFSGTPTNGTYFFWAIRSYIGASGRWEGRWAAPGDTTFKTCDNNSGDSFTVANMYINSSLVSGEWYDGENSFVRIWDAELTDAELWQEMNSGSPVRFDNLHLFTPLWNASDASKDYSGNGKNWTIGGTLSDAETPPVTFLPGLQWSTIESENDLTVSMTGGAVAGGTAPFWYTPTGINGKGFLLRWQRTPSFRSARSTWLKKTRPDGNPAVAQTLYFNALEATTQSVSISMTGGALAGGTASVQTLAIRASIGGGIAGGTAAYARIASRASQGGAIAGGTAAYARIASRASQGGAIAGGSASVSWVPAANNYIVSMTGGAIAGGVASVNTLSAKVGTGGAIAGGTASVTWIGLQLRTETMTGGAVAGGIATAKRVAARSGLGGAIAGGTASVTWITPQVVAISMTGGAVAGGVALIKRILKKSMTGGAVAGGSATLNLLPLMSGAILVIENAALASTILYDRVASRTEIAAASLATLTLVDRSGNVTVEDGPGSIVSINDILMWN